MNILVCIKQVPDTMDVKINPKTNNLDREGIESVMNPYDKNAIEEGLRIKEDKGGKVVVMTMGPPQAKSVLMEALAMGADEAVLLTDRAFAGADTVATSFVIAEAIKKLDDDFDIIFCGKHAVDADTGQVGPSIAENLNIAQITFVEKIKVDEDVIIAKRAIEDGYEIVEAKLPVLLTVTDKINTPRYPKPLDIMKAARKTITELSASDIQVSKDSVGQAGSPTIVGKLYTPQPRGNAEIFEGKPEEACDKLIEKLLSEKII